MKIGTMTRKKILLQYYAENKLTKNKQAKNIYLSHYFLSNVNLIVNYDY